MLPEGGYILAAIEAYFDESGTHAGSPFLCVAGYLFEAKACVRFDAQWRAMLEDFRLPYFHRAPCETGDPPFDKLDGSLRRAIRNRATSIIMAHLTCGIVVGVEPPAYEKIMPKHALVGDAYTFCATGCLHAVRAWAEKQRRRVRIAYFFESGAPSQRTANEIIELKVARPKFRKTYRYKSHSFRLKEESTPLQAADILAWHWRDQCVRASNAIKTRADFLPLIDNRTMVWNFRDKELHEFAAAVRTTAAEVPDADPDWEDRPYRHAFGEQSS